MKAAAPKVPSPPDPPPHSAFPGGLCTLCTPPGGDLVFWGHGAAPYRSLGGRQKDADTTASPGRANITPGFRRGFN